MIQMSAKEKLTEMTGTRLSQEEFDFVKQVANEKEWTIAQVLRKFVRDQMKQEVEVVA